jgi:hypothetical protein
LTPRIITERLGLKPRPRRTAFEPEIKSETGRIAGFEKVSVSSTLIVGILLLKPALAANMSLMN